MNKLRLDVVNYTCSSIQRGNSWIRRLLFALLLRELMEPGVTGIEFGTCVCWAWKYARIPNVAIPEMRLTGTSGREKVSVKHLK